LNFGRLFLVSVEQEDNDLAQHRVNICYGKRWAIGIVEQEDNDLAQHRVFNCSRAKVIRHGSIIQYSLLGSKPHISEMIRLYICFFGFSYFGRCKS